MFVHFSKMSGAGNDFVVINNLESKIKRSKGALARKLCDRKWGIGADGLLMVERSRKASYKMMYYNADGSYGGMCGNGGRCIARFAVTLGLAESTHSFEALDHIYQVKVLSNNVVLDMRDPKDLRLHGSLSLDGSLLQYSFIDTGSPHVVVDIDQPFFKMKKLAEIDVVAIGRRIRTHRKFHPSGCNVNFVDRDKKKNSLRIRTYERGVEDETLACGTGSVASAIVAGSIWRFGRNVEVTPASRKTIHVKYDLVDKEIVSVKLIGPAEIIFEGTINV